MTAQTKRAFTRTRHEVPIRYGYENTDRYFDSKIYNSSKGGMYFETDHALKLDSNINIAMENFPPVLSDRQILKHCTAEVRWCRKLSSADPPRYGVGARVLTKCDEVSKASIHGINLECDLCGKIASSKECHQSDDLVCLCSCCFTHLETLSEGETKESIRRFLTKNVI
jgi:hypothetical protein